MRYDRLVRIPIIARALPYRTLLGNAINKLFLFFSKILVEENLLTTDLLPRYGFGESLD